MAYIYKITNDINGKVYVGKTEQSVERRWKEHCNDYQKERCQNRPLYRAMYKYGIEHFHIETLEETNSAEEREVYWIEKLQSFKTGYNATVGGDGRKYLDYDLIYSTYQEVQNAAEVARRLGISTDSVYAVVHQRGTVLSTQEVSKNYYGKVIKMLSKQNEYLQSFASLKDASRYLIDNQLTKDKNLSGISSHIRQCANGKRKTAYGFIWSW
jgi:hypothetical protein